MFLNPIFYMQLTPYCININSNNSHWLATSLCYLSYLLIIITMRKYFNVFLATVLFILRNFHFTIKAIDYQNCTRGVSGTNTLPSMLRGNQLETRKETWSQHPCVEITEYCVNLDIKSPAILLIVMRTGEFDKSMSLIVKARWHKIRKLTYTNKLHKIN